MPIQLSILDPNPTASVAQYCKNFSIGNFQDYDTVYNFGKNLDIITFEIELVNLPALKQLEKEGIKVFPRPKTLSIIQDKGGQREFFANKKIPGPNYELIENLSEITINPPFVWKARQGGYDGKGVQIVKTVNQIQELPQVPALIEELVEIEMEISVLAARDNFGKVFTYPPCQMHFHPEINLLTELSSEITLSPAQKTTLKETTIKIAEALEIQGVFAVEYFLTKSGEILLNEVSPRPHNSGHQTIYCESVSQNEQHLKAILGLPIEESKALTKSTLINIVKAKENFTFDFTEINTLAKHPNVNNHIIWYHKEKQALGRKLGHIVLTSDSTEDLNEVSERLLKHIY